MSKSEGDFLYRPKFHVQLWILLIALGAGRGGIQAAILSWSGDGASGNWNDSANWGSAGTPANGDTLIFPAAQPRLTNTNNILSLTVNQIRFVGAGGGYAIFGNTFILTNNIQATNTAGLNTINNNIDLAAMDITANVGSGASLTLNGVLAGSVGLAKNGAGTLRLAGFSSNTYAGATTVNAGTLELFKGSGAIAVPGRLFIGDGVNVGTVRNFNFQQIANTANVTINRLSQLDLSDFPETIGALTMSGGGVQTGTAALTLGGNLTILSNTVSSVINGVLSLGGVTRTFSVAKGSVLPDLRIQADIIDGGGSAGINQTGSGQTIISGTNSYTGLTTINGFYILQSDTALGANGSAASGTVVNDNAFLLVAGFNIGNEFLTINSGVDFRSSGTAGWAGPIELNDDVTINVFGGTFTNSGAITGPGGVTKAQTGTLIYAGSGVNTYSGNTIVNQGTLLLAKSVATAGIVDGILTIGDDVGGSDADVVREMGANQINSSVPITINSSGLLDLNNFNDALGALTFSGGHLSTGTGTATLAGNITANTNANNLARIDGIISSSVTRVYDVAAGIFSPDIQITAAVGGAGGIVKFGRGEMSLTASNSYAGLTTVSNGFLRLENSFALGATNTGTVINSGASVGLLFGIHVGLEPLTVSGTSPLGTFGALSGSFGSNSWAGTITLNGDTTFSAISASDFLNLAGAINGTGDITKIGPGTLIFSGSDLNSYSGSTFMNEGTLLLNKTVTDGAIPHDLFVGDGTGGALSDVVRLIGNPQIATVSAVTVASSGLFDLNEISEGIGTLAGSGEVDLGSLGTGALVLNGNGTTTYSGRIIGAGGDVFKGGVGTFTLTGANTYSGLTTVNNGVLIVNGTQPSSPVQVNASGTLGGSGIVGSISNVLGGFVIPGGSPGILTSSNVVFSGAASDFTVELNGTAPGTGYDQLNVRGTVSLGGATLHVLPSFVPADSPAEGAQFVIINNDGADGVSGTFAGLPNNSVLTAGGLQFRINYLDTFGNDVFLTLTNTAVKITGTTISSGNGDAVIQADECDLLTIAITNVSAGLVTNISSTLFSQTPGVAIVQPFSAYPNIAANSRGTNLVPFQISISPSFVCGQNIDLTLAVVTGNNGTFSVPLVLNSGSAGSPIAFNNNSVKTIPDGGSTNSTLVVSGIAAPVARVTLSLNINHSSDADLDLFLRGPDGTIVELSTDNGGSGNNYGNSCAQRTTFDDSAVTAIASGTAPFFGTFRPEGSLADFRGKSGTNVNGTWTLLMTDDTVNALGGELDCWTLNIFPATCSPGGGACELCPNTTVTGILSTNSAQQTARLFRDSNPSICGAPKTCPGPADSGTRSYDAYTFQNGLSNACITVALTTPGGSLFSAAYSNSFNPASLCSNYLADAGNSTLSVSTQSYSFNVSADSTFVVVVNEVDAGTGGPYTLAVTGGDCRPVLNISPDSANKVRLDWTTSANGYALESTNNLVNGGAPVWPPVTNVPVVVNSRFQVTNDVVGTNQFYRLRRPVP